MKILRRIVFLFKPNWIWRMAYRESHGQRRRLLLFILAISVGVGAIVAIQSFSHNVTEAMDTQSRKLLGADLVITSRSPFSDELNQFMATIPGEHSREVRFSTMAFFSKNQGSRLVQVRAMEGDFPYYGKIETVPENSIDGIKTGDPHAIVEDSLLLQFDMNTGDVIKIGDVAFTIAGRLKKLPGEGLIVSQLAPRVIIPMNYLDKTRLVRFGSRVFYRNSFKYIFAFDDRPLMDRLKKLTDKYGISVQTMESRKESLGKTLGNLFYYLNLVGLATLLLGGIGIGSSMHVYMNRKLNTVAILRCLGAKGSQTMVLYFLQALTMGLAGGVIGVGLGVGLQNILPIVLHSVLPVDVPLTLSWKSICLGIFIGVLVTVVFSLSPLIAVWHVSPAETLRFHYESYDKRRISRIIAISIIIVLIVIYSVVTAQNWKYGFGFAFAILLSFMVMILLAKTVTVILKRSISSRLPFVLRQGLSNLHRPQNQTQVLVLCLGIGAFLILTLILSKHQLISQVKRSGNDKNPNMVLFDIQPDQLQQITSMLSRLKLPIIQQVPIVSMRLSSINGVPIEQIRKNNRDRSENGKIPRWSLNREYRSTYRDHFVDSEELIAGDFIRQSSMEELSVPISIEQGIAKDLQVELGDEIVFDVQGLPMQTTISSIRKVDWYKIQPNFFVVFPKGVLEEAPQTYVVVTHVKDSNHSALLQRESIMDFPNVSTIDLTLVLDTMTDILDNISFAIEFMAIGSIVTGFIILVSAVQINQFQRLKENVLLKILGASRRQILGIMITEYFTLGFLAVNTGILLALCGSMALSRFVFEAEFSIDWSSIVVANIAIVGPTIAIGILNSTSLYKRQPLEVLRHEIL